MDEVLIGIAIIFGIIIVVVITWFVALRYQQKIYSEKIGSAEEKSRKIIDEALKVAETKKREALLEAKEENLKSKNELDKEIKERRNELSRMEKRAMNKEETLDRKTEALEKREAGLNAKEDNLNKKLEEAKALHGKVAQELERISGLTSEQAKEYLLKTVEDEVKYDAAKLIKELETKAKEEAAKKAKEYVVTAIQKCAADHVAETTISVVQLPNDEMKGRIIGREGRNIRTLETLTGVELIIDDTPEAVILSGFDPMRREIARIALEKLILDGRIHPARIEEMVEKARVEIEQKIKQEGENAAMEMGIMNLNKELVKTLGRLYYRTSYGQNVLLHSLEVGHIAGMIAAEIGANVKIAKRAGLLHDIGKAVDQTQEGTHIELGVELARKYGEKEEVIHAIEAHHDDVTANTIEAVLVKLADAVSAGRPGSRRDTLEIYIKRLQKLEEIALSYDGIKQSFAVQAGREVRVVVQPEKFDDVASARLARDIAKRIEEELDYPGQIRVTVVREIRTTEVAK